jgi:uncharacterized membrane protein YccC
LAPAGAPPHPAWASGPSEGSRSTLPAPRPPKLTFAFARLGSPLRWTNAGLGTSLICLPAIALSLATGIAMGKPAAGMVAAGGALSVGFGAFQQLSSMRALPMILAAIGMAVSTLIGSALGAQALPFALLLGLWAGFCGLATTLGAGAWWTVLQWVIAMLVAGSRPGTLLEGAERGLLVLFGGGLQLSIVSAIRTLHLLPEAATQPLPRAPLRTAGRLLRRHLSLHAPTGRYAAVLAVSVGGMDLIARQLDLPNGYWAPMTLLILLKPAFRDTLMRGVQRIFGTLGGAGVATLAAAWLRPSEAVTAGLITLSAFGAYSLLRVNYLAYSICMTAYIAFMLTLAGTPEPIVALNRIIGTVAGGISALIVHSAWAASERWRIQKNARPAKAMHQVDVPGH